MAPLPLSHERLPQHFAGRQALVDYLAGQFPSAAARDSAVSPIRGGAAAAEQKLAAIEPRRYAATRNFLNGSVTRLSPYIRHGVLTLARVHQYALQLLSSPRQGEKFISELAWRDYWQRLYYRLGNAIWDDQEGYKTGLPAGAYAKDLPADLTAAQTGLACMDSFVRELHETGYLHNHARMWLAAYVVHWRRVRWQAGAAWFLLHLLDGDPASNNLSWQWVASTFSHKPYFFNRENLERYTGGSFCRDCPKRTACPFDAPYATLEDRLFRIAVDRIGKER